MAEHPRAQRKRLVVLGAGAAQLGLLEAAAARDVTVIAVDRDPLARGFALADERAVISSEDEEGIERLARARAVDGLISPGADWPVGIAARVAERLGLPHPISGATAVLATTKTRQRERFAATGVLQPHTFSVGDPTTVARFSSGVVVALGTIDVGLKHQQGSISTDATGPVQTAAAKVRITCNTTPGAGVVRITVFYRTFTSPSS